MPTAFPILRAAALGTMLALCVALPAFADWNGRGEAGAVIASGNTETKAFNAKLALNHKVDPWSQQLGLTGVYASNAIGTTAQRWEALAQTKYEFNPNNFTFGGLRYESDKFSGFRYQGTVSAGVGHIFSDTDDYLLTAQIGAGYKFFEKRAAYSRLGVLLRPDEKDTALAGIANVDFRKQLTATTSVTNRLTAEYTAENTFLQNELALQVKMSDKLALALGYAVRYNTDPPPTFGNSDTLTTANIVYEVK